MRILVDGNYLASRYRHTSVATLFTSDGRRSGIIYGFFRTMNWLVHSVNGRLPDLIVVWDGGRSKERMRLYPQYKDKRYEEPETEEDKREVREFFDQMRTIRRMLPTIGANTIRVEGAEADDLISIIAHQDDCPTYIYSVDKDFHQIAGGHITLVHPKHGEQSLSEILDIWGAKFSEDIVRIRAIIGDRSDKITGVPGIGPKKAIPAVYDAASPHAKKTREHWDIVERNMKLMKLPKSLSESYYSPAQIYDFRRQMNSPHEISTAAFYDHCKEWELEEIAETFRW